MDYIDSSPENGEYVTEIRRRRHFNTLHQKLLKSKSKPSVLEEKLEDYPMESRVRVAELLEKMTIMYEKETLPFYKVIDKFLEETGFDLGKFREEFERSDSSRIKSQLMLCPLYIHLRRAGYSEHFIVK